MEPERSAVLVNQIGPIAQQRLWADRMPRALVSQRGG